MKLNMKNPLNKIISFAAAMFCVASAFADEKPPTPPTVATNDIAEAKYAQAIEGRAADILKVLELNDAAKASKVRDIIIAQYRDLRAWTDLRDQLKRAASSKATSAGTANADIAETEKTIKSLHSRFIAKLSAELNPEQVEKVKDKMTYNKVQVTYDAYCRQSPALTAEEKAKILDWLKQAREEAMDGGSSEEKSAVFNKYKGKINNYLSQAGYDLKTGAKKKAVQEEKTDSTK